MLRSAHALTRWLLAVLGVLAVVSGAAGAIPASVVEDDEPTCLAPDEGGLGIAIELTEGSSENRTDEERDEEDSTDSEDAALRQDDLRLELVSVEVAARALNGRRRAQENERAAHRGTLERPPHA